MSQLAETRQDDLMKILKILFLTLGFPTPFPCLEKIRKTIHQSLNDDCGEMLVGVRPPVLSPHHSTQTSATNIFKSDHQVYLTLHYKAVSSIHRCSGAGLQCYLSQLCYLGKTRLVVDLLLTQCYYQVSKQSSPLASIQQSGFVQQNI